jgi:hypothetical protein
VRKRRRDASTEAILARTDARTTKNAITATARADDTIQTIPPAAAVMSGAKIFAMAWMARPAGNPLGSSPMAAWYMK